jgi:hypothetical protein
MALAEGMRRIQRDRNVDKAALALTDRAGQYTAEVLQFVVLHKAVGIAVIVRVGHISGADAILSDHEIGCSDMSGMFAHERKDTKNLRNQKYSDHPRAQMARCGCWKHQEPDRRFNPVRI